MSALLADGGNTSIKLASLDEPAKVLWQGGAEEFALATQWHGHEIWAVTSSPHSQQVLNEYCPSLRLLGSMDFAVPQRGQYASCGL